MPSDHRRLRLDPVFVVALALLGAAIMVVYLQRRALVELEQQSTVILDQILAQTANDIARDLRAAIEAPAYQTLEMFTRAELQATGLEGVLRTYEEAVGKYPQIDRFFVWSSETEAFATGEVLFFSGPGDERRDHGPTGGADPAAVGDMSASLWRDPELGRRIYLDILASNEAQKESMRPKYRQSSMGLKYRGGDCTYDILGSYWLDPERDRFFFMLGVVVCLERAGERLIADLYDDHIGGWLHRGGGDAPLDLHVFDSERRLIFGSAPLAQGIARSATLPALSYPYPSPAPLSADATGPAAPGEWTVRVSAPSAGPAATRTQSHWLLAMSVLLMLVALMVAVRGQQRAWELAAMQSEFVSHVSHQLKTPLSLLTAVTDTLALDRVKSPDKLAQYIAIVRAETKRLSTLVEGTLEFSRVEGRGRRYQLEPVELVPLVRESVGAFAQKLAAEGFAIRVVDDGSSPIVRADPAALEQALVNLLDNAVKYSADAREVQVRVHRAAGDAVVEVEDRGIGIPLAEQPRIFERFYRGAGANQRSGFGLGLAIVNGIVAAHRGRVEVDSAPGRGSVFRIRLALYDTSGHARFRVWRGRAERPSSVQVEKSA